VLVDPTCGLELSLNISWKRVHLELVDKVVGDPCFDLIVDLLDVLVALFRPEGRLALEGLAELPVLLGDLLGS
jgi:hypothetical protein